MSVSDSSSLDDLRRLLDQSESWADRFRQLAQDIVAASAYVQSMTFDEAAMTCEECEAVLDWFIDDRLNARSNKPLHTRVRRHLATCQRCRLSFTLLIETLAREHVGQLPSVPMPAPLALSFLHQPDEHTPWITRLKSKLFGASFSLSIAFSPLHLRSMLAPSRPAFAIRADETITPPTPQLLMSDTIMIEDQILAVEVTARRSLQPDHITLQAMITSSGSLPPNLWAKLTWANDMYQTPVDGEGQAIFDAVPLDPLNAGARDFEIAFEVRESANDDA